MLKGNHKNTGKGLLTLLKPISLTSWTLLVCHQIRWEVIFDFVDKIVLSKFSDKKKKYNKLGKSGSAQVYTISQGSITVNHQQDPHPFKLRIESTSSWIDC